MAFLSSMNIVASGLTAQQLRMDVVAENITNATTTRTEKGGAYRRKMVVMEAVDGRDDFRTEMARAQFRADPHAVSNRNYQNAGGVRVTQIAEDPSDFKRVYDPTHPDADEAGYVDLPNVDTIKEMADAMAATQAYAANVTAFNTLKTLVSKGLEIGK